MVEVSASGTPVVNTMRAANGEPPRAVPFTLVWV